RCLGDAKMRRGWDSNPRKPCDFSGFQDRRIRPLCHPSDAVMMRVSSRSDHPMTTMVDDNPRQLGRQSVVDSELGPQPNADARTIVSTDIATVRRLGNSLSCSPDDRSSLATVGAWRRCVAITF